MKILIFVVIGLALGISIYIKLFSDGASRPQVQTTTSNTILIEDRVFKPATLTVKVGTEVTWNNVKKASHTVTSDNAAFDSGSIVPGATYKHVFNEAGTYPYHSEIHPMTQGKIIVQ